MAPAPSCWAGDQESMEITGSTDGTGAWSPTGAGEGLSSEHLYQGEETVGPHCSGTLDVRRGPTETVTLL